MDDLANAQPPRRSEIAASACSAGNAREENGFSPSGIQVAELNVVIGYDARDGSHEQAGRG